MKNVDYYIARRIGMVLTIILMVLLCSMIVISKKAEEKNTAYLESVSLQMREERIEEEKARAELEAKDSFYQKLVDGFDVNILIVGDSIGAGSGASAKEYRWFNILENALENTYGIRCNVTNVSMGGNTSYAGYVRTMCLDEEKEYDLAIICYGQNDGLSGFGMYYEAMVRAIRSNNEKCSIISILESSQKEYTEKMITIQNIAEHYGILVADTIKPFTDGSKGEYDELAKDGVHPSDKGQAVYAEVVESVISEATQKYLAYDNSEIGIIYEGVEAFDNFKWIDVNEFEKKGNGYSYVIDAPISGSMGIDYKYVSGENSCEIYIDGEVYATPEIYFKYDFSQQHILLIGDEDITAKKSIEIKFGDEEQANGFGGVCFSWE